MDVFLRSGKMHGENVNILSNALEGKTMCVKWQSRDCIAATSFIEANLPAATQASTAFTSVWTCRCHATQMVGTATV